MTVAFRVFPPGEEEEGGRLEAAHLLLGQSHATRSWWPDLTERRVVGYTQPGRQRGARLPWAHVACFSVLVVTIRNDEQGASAAFKRTNGAHCVREAGTKPRIPITSNVFWERTSQRNTLPTTSSPLPAMKHAGPLLNAGMLCLTAACLREILDWIYHCSLPPLHSEVRGHSPLQ